MKKFDKKTLGGRLLLKFLKTDTVLVLIVVGSHILFNTN